MKNKKLLFGLLLGTIFVTALGVTYSFFNLTVEDNESASTLQIHNTVLQLTYEGGIQIVGNTVEPSNTTPIATKELVITNDGSDSTYYKLYWQELYNELVKQNSDSEDELYVTATCTSYTNYGKSNQAVSGTCEGFTKDIPTQTPAYIYSNGTIDSKYIISENKSVTAGITHVYNISVYFRNEEYNQNYNQNKVFYGSIGVGESEAVSYVVTPKSSLSAYTWAEIKQLSDALVAGTITTSQLSSTYHIAIGDTTASVSITPSGGTSESHAFRLVGLNHDVDASGNTLGMTFEQTDLISVVYAMKTTMTENDGWVNSDLKLNIDNFTVASDLDAVITPAKKTSTTLGNSNLSYSTSKLWIMSETEIAGTQTRTYLGLKEGSQYEYYVTNNTATARIKQQDGSNLYYWLRTVNYWDSTGKSVFANNGTAGIINYCYANASILGVSICFCI